MKTLTGKPDQLVAALMKAERDQLFDLSPHKEKRSKDANALLWHCIGEIAKAVRRDKWDIYLDMLRHFGQYTYVLCKPAAVDKLRQMWRETEVIGEVDVNGQKSTQVLCYYGSSTYDTKQFSVLLDGVIQEMVNMDLQPPTPKELRSALEAWEKQHEKRTSEHSDGLAEA